MPCPHGPVVFCWRVAIDALATGDLARFGLMLNASERAKADRFIHLADRRRFIATHGALRLLAGAWLNLPPRTVRLDTPPGGKPICLDASLSFNISHSGDIGLIALTQSHPTGVDVEKVRRLPAARLIAERHFHPGEIADLATLSGPEEEVAFFRCWTRKEAVTKAIGRGLGLPLNTFRVSCLPDQPAELIVPPPNHGAAWSLVDLDVGPGYRAALAVPAGNLDLRLHVFAPASRTSY